MPIHQTARTFGARRVPTATAASGCWQLGEVTQARRAGIWPSASDPYFSKVQLLLPMDGTNGSTTFTDESDNGLTVTANGNAAISTSESKFGGASAAFDGTGDFIQTAASTALQLGTDNFTIEAWVFFTALNANTTVARLAGGNSIDGILFCYAVSSGAGKLFISSNGSTWDVRNNGSDFTGLTTNQWFHLALSRSGTTFRTFVNGTLISTFTNSASIYQSSNIARIGAANSDGAFAMSGYIDDFRITKGTNGARYTAAFTPPTAPHPTY